MTAPLTVRRVAGLAAAGAVTMFLVHPPADLWPLAWLAPLPWLALVRADALPAGWVRVAWVAGLGHWLATIHWLRLHHPATAIGWVALSAYLAVYLPLFIWLARRLVHGRSWPLVPAATLAWSDNPWGALTAALKDATGRKGRALFLPLRQALTGMDHGPDMGELLPLIGEDEARARLSRAAA